jgi:translation elongation factor EF-1beta
MESYLKGEIWMNKGKGLVRFGLMALAIYCYGKAKYQEGHTDATKESVQSLMDDKKE